MPDSNKITYFAETDSRNKRYAFGIKSKDRLRHVYVIGKTGTGKSTLLENMAIQDITNGEGMSFIDPHGKTAELLLDYVPEERIKDVVYFAPFDVDYPISFNVMEDVGPDKRHLVSNGLMSAFKKIWVDAWSARMEYILNNILLALLEYPDSTLIGVNRMLSDKEYRKKVVDNITDPSVKSFWVDEFAKYGDRYMQEAGAAIQNKIGQFVSNPLVRNIIGQPKSTFDIRELMDSKKILIINLSKGRVGETNANLLGSMLITKIYLAAMSRADKNEAELNKLPNFYLYVDEFQSFANESFADILSEARKYKLNLTIAHQYIDQMSDEVRSAVFGNVGTMIAFRAGAFDAEVLEKEFSPTFVVEDLVNLGLHQIYLKLMIDGISSQPFSAVTMPPIKKPDISYTDKILESSRKMFANPREKVEEEIKKWHETAGLKDFSNDNNNGNHKNFGDNRYQNEPRKENRYDKSKSFNKPFEQNRPQNHNQYQKPQHFDKQSKPIDENINRNKEIRPPQNQNIEKNKDGFTPLQSISLDSLKKPVQDKKIPTAKNMDDLRSALSSLVKTNDTKKDTNTKEKDVKENIDNKKNKPKEIPEDVLKNMLEISE